MGKLADCLAKAKDTLAQDDVDMIEGAYEHLVMQGHSPEVAAVNAVESVIDVAIKARADIVAKIEKAGGVAPPAPARPEDFASIFMDELDQAYGKKPSAAPPKKAKKSTPAAKPARKAAKSAAINTAKGIDEAMSALTTLFGAKGNRLGSGPTFDEETYRQALPHFKAAVRHFKAAGDDIRQLVRAVVRYFQEHGMERSTLENMMPSLQRFTEDVQAGRESIDEDSTRVREPAPGLPQGGEAPDSQGSGGGRGADDVPQQRRPKRGGTVRGPGSPDDGRPEPADRSGAEDGGPRGDSADSGRDRPRKRNLSAELTRREKERQARAQRNYRITDADRIGQGSAREKVRANIEAIRVLKSLEGRPATPEEKAKLVKYVGWGAFAQDLFQAHGAKEGWAQERKDLQNLLDTKEWEAARASTTNAHYTSQDVIKGMWDAIEHLGFKGGRALEPSAGVGHFIGLIPDRIQAATDWSAVELDPTTGGIAKALYAGADVNVQGFETFVRPSGFYDLAVSNVPFGNYKLRDPSYPRLSIHDYFFVKSLDKVRPGGLVAFITSAHTMDKMDDRARREIAKRGELVGAIRLPGGRKGAFAGNAGTEVTTDILFLRRKPDGAPDSPIAQKWDGLTEISTKDGPVKINEYFAKNPQMMLGEPRLTGTMYASKEFQLEPYTDDRGTLQEQMALAVTQMPALVMTSGANTIEEAPLATVEVNGAKPGAFFFDKGAIYQNIEGVGVKQEKMSGADVDRIRALIPIRDTINQLLGNQAAGNNVDNDLLRKRLNKAYDAFVKEFGPINKTTVTVTDRLDARGENVVIRKMPNFNAFKRDPDAYKVAAIEMYDADRDEAKKAAIFETDVIGVVPDPVIASPLDTIAVSLNKHGRLDIADMADMAGVTEDELIEALGDRVFLNPKGAVYETAEQYLSGDVVTKLSDARAAAQSDPDYQKNVDALEKVQPTPLTREDIGINFGSSWVPKEVFQQFLAEEADAQVELAFNDYAKSWAIKTAYRSEAAQAKYGTNRVEYKQIIAAAMNSTPLRVMDRNADGTETLNQDATMEARAKIEALQTAFTGDREKGIDAWVWKDDERAAYLEGLYNAGFNRIVPQKFDGSHLTFPGLAKSIKKTSGEIVPFSLRKHQKDAVWRIIQNGNTLLDHVVGAGKTFTMIVAGMEMRRLGQISRPVFTVPNHMLEQFSREFLQAYPGANILVANKDEMDRDNRRAFAAKVSAQKWDGIIMTHSGFSRVSMSPAAYEEYLRAELADAEEAIAQTREDEGRKSPTVKEIEKAKKRIETKLADLLKKEAKDVGITFEELGIDTIFVDEAHLFKNLNFFTRHTRVKGLAQGASQRATDLFMKIQHIDKRRPGRSAIFATGTPISNTMAEAYTMQRYLQLDKLRELGIDRFDAWASTFGKLRTAMELAPDGRTLQEVTSFSKFVNIPEMMNIFGLVSDTKTAADLNLPRPTLATGKPIVVEAEPDGMEENYIQDLIERARTVKGKKVEKGGDNMLKIVGDGRKVATDRRLIFGDVGINPNGKVAKAVDNIFRIYQAGVDPALVQTVFLDLGTPKTRGKGKAQTKTVEDPDTGEEIEVSLDEAEIFLSAFNIYDDMRTRLVQKGIPLKEIAFIHDATDDVKKAQMFDKARRGKIRVLFGSTSKMGVGTNIPDRLIAQHEIDAPWKPAEVEQRGGRIVRQGNLNPEVSIYRYITKRSFDAFMWQTLERKAGFIAQLKAGARGIREAEDIDSPLPDAAELKAAATGDPRIMQYAELQKEVRNLDIAQTSHFRTISSAKMALGQQRSDKARHEKAIAVLEADNAKVTDTRGDAFTVEIMVGEKPGEYTARKEAGDQIVKFAVGQMDRVWGKTEYTVGRLSGFTMKLIVSRDKDGRHVYEARLEGEGKYERWGSAAFLTPDTEGSPLVQQYERLLRDIPDGLAYEKQRLARVEEAIPKLEVTAQEKPFPRGDELREKKAKLKALEDELRPKKEDAAAPAGPVQPSFGLTGITEKVRENIAEDVQRYARRILGHEITVRVVRKIVDAQGRDTGMAGAYSNRDKAVFIALDHAVNWRGTLRHEAIHALRDAGVITPAEWKVLSRYAQKIWMPRNPHIRENYEGYYRDKFTALTPAELEDVVVEEGVADVFERERLGTLPDNVPGAIRRLIRKILDFIERVRNLVEGAGFKTAGDIFGEIESGRAIERERRQENRRGYELVDRDEVLASQAVTETKAFKDWFGDSKVVNADGSPKVVYHGTDADFHVFRRTEDIGFHFGSRDVASKRLLSGAGYGVVRGESAKNAYKSAIRDGYEIEGGHVMPVYLKIENPLPMPDLYDWAPLAIMDNLLAQGVITQEQIDEEATGDLENGGEVVLDRQLMQKWLGEAGYDGIVYINKVEGTGASYIVFDSAQIKSVFNRGTFDPNDKSILASRPMPPSRGPVTFQAPIDNPAAVWALTNLPLLERLENTAGAAWRPVRAKMQDSMIDWARVQKEIEKQRGPIHAAADVYRTEILYSGRTGKRIDDFRENDVIPLINAMAAEGVTQDDLWDYLSAKYAPKRNAQIARIDPSMPDGGSGITDAEAVQMLRDLHSRGALLRTARIARKVYAIRDATRDRLLANGIISQRQYDELVKEPFYVPFQGFRDNAPDDATRLAIGMKYDTRAAPVKRALGRKSKADSPLAYVLAQAQQSIVLSEKARVSRTVLRLALDHPQSELWEVNQVVKVKYFDKQTGMVATFNDGRQRTMAPNVLAVRQGGKLYWVTLHHKGLLEGVKGIEGSQMHVLLRALAKLQRFYALVRTAWSPQFFITNFARDLETAAIHISAEQGARIVKNTIRDIPKAIAATWRHETMGQRAGNQWVQFAEDHALAGGKVGIFGLYSIEDTKRKITKELKLAAGGPTANLEKAADRAMELMSGVNGAIENAIRLSLYVNMIREGFTRDQAAIASKEVTVNFNRKGTWGSNVNAFYVFFNAGAQGITRVVSVMRKYPKVRAALLGTIAAGFLLDMANAWMSGDSDDDGEDDYDQLPEYITERNLVFMWPWSEEGEHSKVPLTWVYNVFPYAGQQLGRTVRGKISPWTAAANVISAAARSMNPLGATNVGEMLSPTFLDPLYQLRGNRDGLDRPIMPEQKDYQVPKPDSQLYFKSVNPTLRELSAWLNTLPMPWQAGGDEIRPGPIDVSPEILEFWVDFIGGGLGGFINQVQTTVTDLASGEIPESEKIPLGRVIYGKLPERVGRNEFYEIKAKIELALEQVKTFEEKGDRRKVAEIRRDYRVDLRMADSLKETEKRLKEIKKRINEAKTTAQRKQLEEERDRVMSRFRRRYRSLGGKL